MLPLRYTRYWRTASVVVLVLVMLSTLMPVGWLFGDADSVLRWFKHADKWAHALTFVVLTLWFAGLYRSFLGIALGLLCFGAVIELSQLMIGYRSAEWLDMAANAAGIITGLGIATTGLGGWSQRAEDWYLTRNA